MAAAPSVTMKPPVKVPALHACIDACDRGKLEALLAAGSDVQERDAWGRTPLHRAVAPFGGWLQGVEVLLAAGADPTARTPEGDTVIAVLRSGVSSALEALEADEIERMLRLSGASE